MRKWMPALLIALALLVSACSYRNAYNSVAPSSDYSGGPAVSQSVPAATPVQTYITLDQLPADYPPELAKENGDVTRIQWNACNTEELDSFIEQYGKKSIKEDARIRIVDYTVEGDAVISELIYSENRLKLIRDNTRDEFSSKADRIVKEYAVAEIAKANGDDNISYIARLEDGTEMPLLYIHSQK
jgi:hypothetical protein